MSAQKRVTVIGNLFFDAMIHVHVDNKIDVINRSVK